MALIPYSMRDGTRYVPTLQRVICNSSSAAYIGDAVVADTAGGNTDGIPEVDVGGDGGAYLGVITDMVPTAYDSEPYKTTATTEREFLIETNPEVLFAIKEDAVGGALAATNIYNVVDLIGNGTGNANSGLSSNLLDSDTAASGSSASFIIERKLQTIGNDIGSSSTIWLVRLNEVQLPSGQSSNGV